jgi:uncharacterized protein YpiB (UPF0302 family)
MRSQLNISRTETPRTSRSTQSIFRNYRQAREIAIIVALRFSGRYRGHEKALRRAQNEAASVRQKLVEQENAAPEQSKEASHESTRASSPRLHHDEIDAIVLVEAHWTRQSR